MARWQDQPMSFEARVLVLLVASPGDTGAARDRIEQAITAWNRDRSRQARVVLLPIRWETDAVPELGADAQSVINRQLVDECDIVIAVFHSRLGAPTPRAASGTAEEIERAHGRGARVHVYFSEMPVPRDTDPAELARLNDFQSELQSRGLLGSYASMDDLAAKVRTALDVDTSALVAVDDRAASTAAPRAVLRARYDFDREPHTDNRGKTRMRNRRQRLVIENIGDAPAEQVIVTISPVGEGDAPILHDKEPIERLIPNSSVALMLIPYAGVASQWRVHFTWLEAGEPAEETQTVTAR